MPDLTFKVHYSATMPQPSWTAWKSWQVGTLTVGSGRAEFRPRHGDPVVMEKLVDVKPPPRTVARSQGLIAGIVETWVSVKFVTDGKPASAYFNDARWWFFLGHYLSHKRMLAALTSPPTG